MSIPINFSIARQTMSQFFKAELKDRFLEYASERDDYFEMQLLYDEFLRPNYSLKFAENLVREIIDYNPELLDIMSGNGSHLFMLSATAYTKEFLVEGGFKDIYIAEEEKWDIFLEQLSFAKKNTPKENANLARVPKTSYKRERNLLYFLVAAVTISFLFTLFSLFKDMVKPAEQIYQNGIERKLEVIAQKNQKELERLEREIETLKKQINENVFSE